MKKSQIIVTSLLSAALLGGAASYLTDTCIGLFSFETMARRTQYPRGRDSTAPFETKTMRVGTFNRIDVSAGIEVIYTQGPLREISIKARRDLMPLIEIHESRGELSLTVTQDSFNNMSINRGDIVVTLASPVCNAIETSSGAAFVSEGRVRVNNKLTLDASSGSSISFSGKLTAEMLEVESSSGATVTLSECDTPRTAILASSSSRLKIADLNSDYLEVEGSSGAGMMVAGKGKKASIYMSSGATFNGGDFPLYTTDLRASSGANAVINSTEVNASCSSGATYMNLKKGD